MTQRRIARFDEQAESITHDRQADYGDARVSFDRIALMWSAITGADITAAQVAHMMIALKLSRLQHQPNHLDSLVDIVGYARCAVLVGPEYDDTADGQPF